MEEIKGRAIWTGKKWKLIYDDKKLEDKDRKAFSKQIKQEYIDYLTMQVNEKSEKNINLFIKGYTKTLLFDSNVITKEKIKLELKAIELEVKKLRKRRINEHNNY